MKSHLFLALAIMSEICGTSAIKASDGFTKPVPSVIAIVSLGVAFYLLSLVVRVIPVGVTYAIWSGAGIALISLIGWLFFKQALDFAAILGITPIIVGVVVLSLFSSVSVH